jgi:phage shock protein A
VLRLALVTGIVGRGKDELARAFLEHKERAEARVASLEQRLAELFKGTQSPPEGDG